MPDPGLHLPVMAGEVIEYLDCGAGKVVVDATVGDGGHAARILEAGPPDGFVIGIDRDREALDRAGKALSRYRGRVALIHGNFSELEGLLESGGYDRVDGLLADLGISSWQVDCRERGFSFRMEAPLDMRMDRSEELTAAKLVGESTEEELAEIIWKYGEERRSRPIARAIRRAAEKGPLTTGRLAEAVAAAVGHRAQKGRRRIHPATRTFQAIRIAVNRETEALQSLLRLLPSILAPGGRCCMISYHSLEDRIVKNAFRDLSGRGARGSAAPLEILTKKPVRPSEEEIRGNPRARSARLRAARMKEEQ